MKRSRWGGEKRFYRKVAKDAKGEGIAAKRHRRRKKLYRKGAKVSGRRWYGGMGVWERRIFYLDFLS